MCGVEGEGPSSFLSGVAKGDTLFREREYPPFTHFRTVRKYPAPARNNLQMVLLNRFQNLARDINTARRCVRERVRDAAAIADDIKPLVRRFKVLVERDLHVVELDLHAVEQRVVVCGTRRDLVERVDHLDDAVQNALGQHKAQITGGRRERRRDEAFFDALDRAAAAADEIAEALDDDAAAEHVGQARDGLAVAVGILERLGEVLGDEKREVRVLGLEGLILIAVAVDRDDAVRVLVDDDAVGVHAERADVVLELFRAIDDLALVELVSQVGEDNGGDLDAHTDIDAVRLRGDLELLAHALHPLAADAADGDDALVAGVVRLADGDTVAFALAGDGGDGRIEVEVDLVLEQVIEVREHDEVHVRAEMADGGVEQVELILDAELFELRAGGGVELRALAAVGHVDLVDIVHEIERLLFANVLVQRAAEVVGDVVFAVGKCARAAETAHDRAALAADAGLDLVAVNGAVALFKAVTGLEHGDAQVAAILCQLVGGEDAAGATADDDDVVMHGRNLRLIRICRRSIPPAQKYILYCNKMADKVKRRNGKRSGNISAPFCLSLHILLDALDGVFFKARDLRLRDADLA